MKNIAVGFLAGGLSKRMGGGDKTFTKLNGKTILDWQLESTFNHDVRIINANGDQTRFIKFGLPVVPDILSGFLGPLVGIVSCLEYLEKNEPHIKYLLSCATDAPFIPKNLAKKLFEGIKKDGSFISQASSFGRRHPVFALWSVSLKKELFDAIKFSQIRKIDTFTEKYKTTIVNFEQRPDPFLNINRPEDIKVAKRELNLI